MLGWVGQSSAPNDKWPKLWLGPFLLLVCKSLKHRVEPLRVSESIVTI